MRHAHLHRNGDNYKRSNSSVFLSIAFIPTFSLCMAATAVIISPVLIF